MLVVILRVCICACECVRVCVCAWEVYAGAHGTGRRKQTLRSSSMSCATKDLVVDTTGGVMRIA